MHTLRLYRVSPCFPGDQRRALLAYSADKGEKLYEVQIGRTGMAPPITYEIDGKPYIALIGGLGRAANIVGPNELPTPAPPAPPGNAPAAL